MKVLAVTLILIGGLVGQALAQQPLDQRVADLEKRVAELEQRMASLHGASVVFSLGFEDVKVTYAQQHTPGAGALKKYERIPMNKPMEEIAFEGSNLKMHGIIHAELK